MKYPCENCKLRAAYDKGGVRDVDNIVEGTTRSLLSDVSGVGKSTSAPVGEATLSRCHLRNRKSFARSMIFGSINNL